MKIKKLNESVSPITRSKLILDESLFTDDIDSDELELDDTLIVNSDGEGYEGDEHAFKKCSDKPVIRSNIEKAQQVVININEDKDKDVDDVFALLNSLEEDFDYGPISDNSTILKPTIATFNTNTVVPSAQPTSSIIYDDDFTPGEGTLSTPIDDAEQTDAFYKELKPQLDNSPEQPETPEDNGIAELIMGAIKDEYDAISFYNSIKLSLQDMGKDEYVQIISDIANEEMLHVGQLQELLKQVSPNAESIKEGEKEAQEQLPQEENNNIDMEINPEDVDDSFLTEAENIDIIANVDCETVKDIIGNKLKGSGILDVPNRQDIFVKIINAIPQNSLEDVFEAIEQKVGNKTLGQDDISDIEDSANIQEDQKTTTIITVTELLEKLNIKELVNKDVKIVEDVLLTLLSILTTIEVKAVEDIISAILVALPDDNCTQTISELIKISKPFADMLNTAVQQ